jgi:hypothetical protein
MTDSALARIEYNDVDTLKKLLVGRSITATSSEGDPGSYYRTIDFTLDNGMVLRAHATDGGCACSNGCFTVEPNPEDIVGTIMNVEVAEDLEYGSIGDGEATIRLFVYSDLDTRQALVTSQGGDNGYYGWGFWLSVVTPEAVSE